MTLLRTDGGVKKGRTRRRESKGARFKGANGGSGMRAPFNGASEYGQPRVLGRRAVERDADEMLEKARRSRYRDEKRER